jgi:hypothetical protein
MLDEASEALIPVKVNLSRARAHEMAQKFGTTPQTDQTASTDESSDVDILATNQAGNAGTDNTIDQNSGVFRLLEDIIASFRDGL